MSDVFARLRGAVPEHTITTVLGTVVSFYLSQSPAVVVKDIVVLAIENENDMNFTANQYVTSHQHEDPNISSVIAWEKSPLKDKQCVASPRPLRRRLMYGTQVHATIGLQFHEPIISCPSYRRHHLRQDAVS
jgi:hypothetical protein